MYIWLELASVGDLSNLESHVSPEYQPKRVAQILARGISNAVKAILIETSYIDKDYRSTFYNFYAKKGQYYSPDCIRLHFFDATVRFEPVRLRLTCQDRLTDHYFGYMVLRPTGIATIGRTILSPDIRSGACKSIIYANHKAHVLGNKLFVQGFPSMNQHVDIAVCAHAACWSILRHYSERYSLYREFLTNDITMMAQEFNPGGLVPSKGLTMSHAERVFQEANTFPLHISKADPTDIQFYRQLTAYVESGFPLFAAMSARAHAVAIVGQEWRSPLTPTGAGMRYAWDEVGRLAVIDDNHLPYLSIPVSGAGPAGYAADDIDAFIVALPEKIYYAADAVDKIAPTLFKLAPAVGGLPPQSECIFRYFVTTASALREFVRERESEFPTELLEAIMTMPLAQFVWIVEIATEGQWTLGQVAARAVIDATASIWEPLPLWLLHTSTNAVVVDRRNPSPIPADRTSSITFATPRTGAFSRMERNLRPTQPK